jgi:negative regulator of flagellin synthesis FlgM
MNPIDTSGPKEVAARVTVNRTAPVTGADPVRPVRSRASDASGSTDPSVSAGQSISAGASAPVDADRVKEIRKAVEEGRYPVVPTRIADAIIAAGYLLRTK